MNNMNIITEKEYRNLIKSHEELIELIISKTTQLSMLLYNAPPKGHFITNLDELDEKDGKICVQFESYSCGESDYDTFYLPLEFLFDESYLEKYKLIWEEEKCKEKEEKDRRKNEEENNRKNILENYERKEYERLKLKFEKSSINLVDIDKIWNETDHTL